MYTDNAVTLSKMICFSSTGSHMHIFDMIQTGARHLVENHFVDATFRRIRQYVDATYRRIRQFVDYDNPSKFRRKMSKFRRRLVFIRTCILNIAASGISIRRASLLVNNNAILRSPSISTVRQNIERQKREATLNR